MSMSKMVIGLLLLTLLAVATAGTIAGGITGRQLVTGKAGDVMGTITDIAVETIDAIQEGLQKVGGNDPAVPAPTSQPGA